MVGKPNIALAFPAGARTKHVAALIEALLVFYGWWATRFVALLLGSASAKFLIDRILSGMRKIRDATQLADLVTELSGEVTTSTRIFI